MVSEKNTNYGSIFLYCFLSFVVVVEVVRFAKPYYNLETLMKTEAVVEEGLFEVESSGLVPCNFKRSLFFSPEKQQKLKIPVRQEIRDRPPTSYCVKFQSFETMSKLVKDNGGKYESRPFTVGGYSWTFIIYPNADVPVGSGGYVSLYVRIDNSSFINDPKDVYAEIKFLTYKSTIDKYHVLQETEAQRFHLFKQEFGQLNFLEIGYYQNPAYGFIFDGGQSVFGVDIFVAETFKQWEVASYEENISNPVVDWKITNYSTQDHYYYTSNSFSSGGRKWKLEVYPNGFGSGTSNSLSLFLTSASNEKGYVKAKLRVYDQIRSIPVEKQVEGYPNAIANGWGFEKFMPLSDVNDASKGFIVNDTLKVEVELLSFSKTDSF